MSEIVLATHGLTRAYGQSRALDNVSITVEKGEIYGLVGRNGAGKTTLMRLVTGQSAPTAGSVELFGQPGRELARARSRTGAMIETPSFAPFLTARENLEYYRIQRGIPGKGAVDEVLEAVDLRDTGKKKFKTFSLGMKQRLGLALALMNHPDFLILDEPINGLDPIGIAAQIWLALQEITGRELPAKTPAVVTVGRFQAGQAPNIIPDEAMLEGTVRTFDRAVTAQIMERIRQLSEGIASAFRGSAQMEELASAPPLQNDPALTEDMAALAETLLGREKVFRLKEGGMGSEDFASYTYELPCAYLLLGAGSPREDPRYGQPMHNPKVVFNEDVLPLGAALLTAGAMHRLER